MAKSEQSEKQEKPRRIVPPMYLAFSILVMYLLDKFVPLGSFQGPFVWGFASAFLAGGLMLILVSAGLFKRAKTPLIPFHKSTAVVTTGPYKLTRNPMYLGMAFILIGVAVALGSLMPFFVILIFGWIIQTRFIVGEERFMEELFGQEYLDYKKRVRRWL